MGTALRDLKSLFFADQAVLLEFGSGRVVGHLYDLKAGRRVRRVTLELEEPEETGREVVAGLYRDLDVRAPGLAAPDLQVPAGPPYHSRWWFWPAVGLGVAAAIAIPVALFVQDEEDGLTRQDGQGALVLRF